MALVRVHNQNIYPCFLEITNKFPYILKAIKHLKNDKARDPEGLLNELFKKEVAGNTFKLSLLKLFNKIKEENEIPNFVKMADVATN